MPLTDEQSADELYWFYKSISRAKESLTVTYCDSDLRGESKKISVAGPRIGYLLNKETINYSEIPVIDKVEGKSMETPSQNISLGARGMTISRLSPMGKVLIAGKEYEAKSIDAYIDQRKEIEVVGFENFTVIVKSVQSK